MTDPIDICYTDVSTWELVPRCPKPRDEAANDCVTKFDISHEGSAYSPYVAWPYLKYVKSADTLRQADPSLRNDYTGAYAAKAKFRPMLLKLDRERNVAEIA